MRSFLKKLGGIYIRILGSPIRDEESGELLGKAFILVWRGRIHLIGFTGAVPLKPVFRIQDRIRYWRQSVGFTRSSPPDFPRERPE